MSCFGGYHPLVTDRKRKNNEVEMKFVSRAKEVGELRSGHDGGMMKEEREISPDGTSGRGASSAHTSYGQRST